LKSSKIQKPGSDSKIMVAYKKPVIASGAILIIGVDKTPDE
jgi:hypothetical protein